MEVRDRVEAAFAAHPRSAFLPEAVARQASYDGPLAIGGGQTCSQPRTVAAMLRLLQVEPGQHVLDVGSGSGWTTALLAHLTGPDGDVLGVEIDPALVAQGTAHVAAAAHPWARVRLAQPGVLGAPEEAPWDRILVSAAPQHLPEELVDQLGEDARMVIPVAGEMLLVSRVAGERHVSRHGAYRFVPLRTHA